MPVPLHGRPNFLPAISGYGLGSYDGQIAGLPKGFNTRKRPESEFFQFYKTAKRPIGYAVVGVAKDSTGAVLGGCVVDLFQIFDPTGTSEPPTVWRARTVSDPVTGAYRFDVPSEGYNYQAVAYLAGAPDVAGVTVNTLRGT